MERSREGSSNKRSGSSNNVLSLAGSGHKRRKLEAPPLYHHHQHPHHNLHHNHQQQHFRSFCNRELSSEEEEGEEYRRREHQRIHLKEKKHELEEDEEEEGESSAMAFSSSRRSNNNSRAHTQESEDEDDDDLPPPLLRHRHTSKFKHSDHLKEETASLDQAVSVSRKLRTAMTKKHQDSPPRHAAETPAKKHKSSSNGRISNQGFSESTSSSLKSVRKTKPSSGSKPKSESAVKSSPSKQELEIAETLFDLARMLFERAPATTDEHKTEPPGDSKAELKARNGCLAPETSVPSPQSTSAPPEKESNLDQKTECKTEVELSNASWMPPSAAPSPQSAHQAPSPGTAFPAAVGSSPPSSAQTPVNSGASKKKHSHSSKAKIGIAATAVTEGSQSNSAVPGGIFTESVCAKQAHQQIESARIPLDNVVDSGMTMPAGSSVFREPTVEQTTEAHDENTVKNHVVDQELREDSRLINSIMTTDKISDDLANRIASDTTPRVESPERSPSPADNVVAAAKLDINLMTPPVNNDDTEREDNVDYSIRQSNEVVRSTEQEINKPPSTGAGSEAETEDKRNANDINNDALKNSYLECGYERCTDMDPGKDNQSSTASEHEHCKLSYPGKENSAKGEHVNSEELKQNVKSVANDVDSISEDAMEKNADGTGLALGPSLLPQAENTASVPMPASTLMSGPENISSEMNPHLDPKVSIPCSSPATTIGATDAKHQPVPLPLLPLSRELFWKHCATHVNICLLIAQQEKSKQFLASAPGNSMNLYGTSCYFPNIPSKQKMDGNGTTGSITASSLKIARDLSSKGIELSLDCRKDSAPTPPESHNIIDKSSVPRSDLHEKKSSSQQETVSSAYGPVTSQSVSSCTMTTVTMAGHTTGMSSVMAFGGNSVPYGSLSFGSGNGPAGIASNVGALQAQFQHPIIQHPTFPVSFSPGQVALAANGHVAGQQGPQFFTNSFYTPHFAQRTTTSSQQQPPANISMSSEPLKQGSNTFANIPGFASLGSLQPISWPSFYTTQTVFPSGRQQQQLAGKENPITEAAPANEIKLSSIQKGIYNPSISFSQTPVTNFSTSMSVSVPTASTQQEIKQVPSSGAKHDATVQKVPEAQAQTQNHTLSTMQPQQSHIVIPSLQIGLKDADYHIPHLSSANRASSSSTLFGLPTVTSIMTPQGATYQGMGNQVLIPDHITSGQSHQLFFPGSQQQQQQHPMQTQRAVLNSLEASKLNVSDGSGTKVGRGDDIKVSQKHQQQPYWEASAYGQGTTTNSTYSLPNVSTGHVDGSSVVYGTVTVPSQQNSKKQMSRSKASSSSVLSPPAQAESTLISFSDRSSVQVTNFGNETSGQMMFSTGQVLDSSSQSRRQGNTSQASQIKGNQRVQSGTSLTATPGTPSQAALTAMARSMGHSTKNEQFWLDPVPTSSRASPAPSVSSFSGSILPSSPTSKSGGGTTISERHSSKDAYGTQSKSSLGVHTDKKSLPSILPNVASFLGSNSGSQSMPSISLPIQNQQPSQKKHQTKQQPRKQQKTSQSPQSSSSIQQQQLPHSPYYQMHQSANPNQVSYPERYALTQQKSPSFSLGDVQQQQVKHIQNQNKNQQALGRHQNSEPEPVSAQNQQYENIQWQNATHLHQHPSMFSNPFSIVSNGSLPSTLTLGNHPGGSTHSLVSDGVSMSHNNNLTSATLNFAGSTNLGSTVPRVSVSTSMVHQQNEYVQSRNDPSDKQ